MHGGPGLPTIRTTELVQDAYVRLVDQTRVACDDRAHFCALAALDERHARIVEYRIFAGLSSEETAAVLGVSAGLEKREWRFARA